MRHSPLTLIAAPLRLGLAAFAVMLGGCCPPPDMVSLPMLAVEGPPLFVVGRLDGADYAGRMARSAMMGFGEISLERPESNGEQENAVICRGKFTTPVTRQGRLHALLRCSDGRYLAVSLRNIGPDQGFGLGRMLTGADLDKENFPPDEPIMPLFYHSSLEEAARRFVQVEKELNDAHAGKLK